MRFLSTNQVIAIHDELVKLFGGSQGIRSKELLESAVFRMQASFDGNDLYKNIFDKAAALLQSLCQNHPFIDGNKRSAFISAVTFLEINNYITKFDQTKAETFMIDVACKKVAFEEISRFLKQNSKKVNQ